MVEQHHSSSISPWAYIDPVAGWLAGALTEQLPWRNRIMLALTIAVSGLLLAWVISRFRQR